MTPSRTLATLVMLALGPLALSACGGGEPQANPTPAPSVTSPAASDPPTGTPTPTPSAVSPSPATFRVPVYWVGDTERGQALYREFRDGRAPDTDSGPALAALDVMLAGTPLDPDYRSLWPATVTVEGVSVAGTVATVELTGAPGGSLRPQSTRVQQLVHTVTAALDDVSSVRLVVDGDSTGTGPISRAAPIDVLAPIWLTDPQEGDEASSPLRISGSAAVFEATVLWEVRQADRVVKRGFTTASIGAPDRGTWSVTVRGLAPGDYVVRVFAQSPRDGAEEFEDDKAVRLG